MSKAPVSTVLQRGATRRLRCFVCCSCTWGMTCGACRMAHIAGARSPRPRRKATQAEPAKANARPAGPAGISSSRRSPSCGGSGLQAIVARRVVAWEAIKWPSPPEINTIRDSTVSADSPTQAERRRHRRSSGSEQEVPLRHRQLFCRLAGQQHAVRPHLVGLRVDLHHRQVVVEHHVGLGDRAAALHR